MNKKTPGYIGIYFGACIIGTILCVAALSWPIPTGILSALIILGGVAQGLKKGTEWKLRLQSFLFAGIAAFALLFSIAASKPKSEATQAKAQLVQDIPQQAKNQDSKKLLAVTTEELQDSYKSLSDLEKDLRDNHRQSLDRAIADNKTVTKENYDSWKRFSKNWNEMRDAGDDVDRMRKDRFSAEAIRECVGLLNLRNVSDMTRCSLGGYSKNLFLLWGEMDRQFSGRAPTAQGTTESIEGQISTTKTEVENTINLLKQGKTDIKHLGPGPWNQVK